MTVLVSGWTGMLGGHVVQELRRRGIDDLMLLSRSPSNEEPTSVTADLTDAEQLAAIDWTGVTDVIHCAAAIPSRADDFATTNVDGTRNLLRALEHVPLRSFVLTSSVSVYATDDRSENASKVTDGYGWTKLQQEQLALELLDDRTALSVFRPSSIYGRGMAQNTVLPIFLDRARSNRTLTITKPGYTQNFVSAIDAAWVLVESMLSKATGTFNLFSESTVDLRTLAETIVHMTGSTSEVVCPMDEPIEREDLATCDEVCFDNERLKNEFPRIQFVSLADGLKELIHDR